MILVYTVVTLSSKEMWLGSNPISYNTLEAARVEVDKRKRELQGLPTMRPVTIASQLKDSV